MIISQGQAIKAIDSASDSQKKKSSSHADGTNYEDEEFDDNQNDAYMGGDQVEPELDKNDISIQEGNIF